MSVRILIGDVRDRLRELPDESVHCIVTSPPYFGLRDYGMPGQIGMEPAPAEFVETMIAVFREARRVLRADGTLWLNLGDSYANDGKWGGSSGGKHVSALHGKSGIGRSKVSTGLKPKDLIGIPWRVAFALQADGWWLRQDIIWHKPNPMPESVTDRCTKAHEYIFLLTKSERYAYDAEAIKEAAIHEGRIVKATGSDAKNGQKGEYGRTAAGFTSKDTLVTDRNRRSVWTVATQPYSGAHFATFPPALIEPCIKAGCPEGGTVLDPFGGAGTTGLVADRLNRNALLIELNPTYAEMAARRIRSEGGMFASVDVAPLFGGAAE
jgi:DNA modification methylase